MAEGGRQRSRHSLHRSLDQFGLDVISGQERFDLSSGVLFPAFFPSLPPSPPRIPQVYCWLPHGFLSHLEITMCTRYEGVI